ncbi:MAG: hypothetical protein HY726_04475 [Candidatus Rokubacteria bacterium]|nr:hypothetical protein [Candidatus Rokubacteria bacterium]
MRSLFSLFLVFHLLLDLAMPWLPGAFRFNPDESVVGVRAQPVHTSDVALARQADVLREPDALPRLSPKTPADPQRWSSAVALIVLLPRRDPSSDPSVPRLTEDD